MSTLKSLVKLRKQKIERYKKEEKTYNYKNNKNESLGIVWVCDFETLTINTKKFKETQDTQIILWAARRRDARDDGTKLEYVEYKVDKINYSKVSKPNEIYTTNAFVCGTDGESFIDFVLNSPKTSTFYFHNLKYDGTFIIPLLNKIEELRQVNFTIEDNSLVSTGYSAKGLECGYWDIFRSGKKIFNIQIRKYGVNRNPININFKCSYLMLSSGVKELGKALNNEMFNNKPLKKFLDDENALGEEFYNVEPFLNLQDAINTNYNFFEYCLRDVEIVRRHINYFHQLFNEEIPTIKERKKEREDFNKWCDETNRKDKKYSKSCDIDVWAMSSTIAGLMRRLLKEIYAPKFQCENSKYSQSTTYLHNDKLKYGNLVLIPRETHEFFTTYHDLYNNGNAAKLFRGGFTQFNRKYQNIDDLDNCGDCGKWDVSSAYPFQMTKPLPFGCLISEEDFNIHYSHLRPHEYYEYLIIPIEEVKPKEITRHCATIPNITKGIDGKYNIPFRYNPEIQEAFTLALVREEWDELQYWYDFKIDEDIETQKYYMLAAPYLKGIAEELYNEKNRFSEEGKSAQKQGVKIAINSVYGSLGIRASFDSLIYMDEKSANYFFENKHDKEKVEQFSFISPNSKTTSIDFKHISEHLNTNYVAVNVLENKELKPYVWNIATASTITALQRVYLMRTIRIIGPEFFAYCDTDSIIFANMTKQARKRMESIEGKGLGAWECEYRQITRLGIHKAKEYIQYINKNNETINSIKSAGFVKIDDNIRGLFELPLQERLKLTKEQISRFYPNQEITNEFVERIRHGETLIENGNTTTLACKSGDVIIRVDKWTKYGVV